MSKILKLENKLSEISKLEEFVNSLSDELSLSPEITFNLNLALEEIATNVISYAYPTDEAHSFTITSDVQEGNMLVLQIEDRGVAFDPLSEAPQVDTTMGIEDRPIGGLGIFLVRKIMDEVSYQRTENSNVLTLRKRIL